MLILVDNKILQFVADYFIPNYLPENCLSYRYSEINHFVALLWGNLFWITTRPEVSIILTWQQTVLRTQPT
jgi:hypothetical protein